MDQNYDEAWYNKARTESMAVRGVGNITLLRHMIFFPLIISMMEN